MSILFLRSKKQSRMNNVSNQKDKPIALMTASVASMIDSFNMDNISLLKQLGYQVHVATNFEENNISSERIAAFKKKLDAQGVRYFHIPMPRNPTNLTAVLKSYRCMQLLVNEWEYSLVHCHSPTGGVVARLACRKARKNGTTVIYTAHGFHFFKGAQLLNWLLFYPIEWFCSLFTDVLITINQEDFSRAKAFRAKRVTYVPGIGVHTEQFRDVQIEREKKRNQLGFTNRDFVFASVGELSVRKNHEVIIRALAKMKNHFAKYLIVGDGALLHSLKQQVIDLGLEDCVIFAGYRNDIVELLHAADAFVFPSLQEGLPVALMEAMSVGMPIVCSRIRGNTDLIEDGMGGYVVDPCDIDGFSDAMKKIMAGNCSEMGNVNINTMKKFDVSVVTAEMEKIYSHAKSRTDAD